MSKHYGNNVEYNSMMLDHGKNKDFYSTSYNFMPGKAEEYQKYVKFVDPSAKISYDGKTMMIESEDGDKISFEDLKKLEPAMKQTELNLGVETLGVDVISKSLNGKMVTDGEIDLKLNALITKANMDNGNIQDGILSLATDLTFKHGNEEFNFYSYLNSDPELKSKYLTEDGKFKTFEDPTQRDTYYKELEKDVKNYFRSSMTTARDKNIAAFEDKQAQAILDKLNAEKDLIRSRAEEQMRVARLQHSLRGPSQGIQESEEQLIERMKFINNAVETGNLSAFQGYALGDGNAIDVDEIIDEGQTFNVVRAYGTDSSVAGTYGLDNAYDKAVTKDKRGLKEALFNAIIGDKWTTLTDKAGINLGANTNKTTVEEEDSTLGEQLGGGNNENVDLGGAVRKWNADNPGNETNVDALKNIRDGYKITHNGEEYRFKTIEEARQALSEDFLEEKRRQRPTNIGVAQWNKMIQEEYSDPGLVDKIKTLIEQWDTVAYSQSDLNAYNKLGIK